jgi:SsrA-binding protein
MMKVITTNRRATHDYEILERFEAGMVLDGSEVKSLREGKANLKDSFAWVKRGEVFLVGAYIAPYTFARDGGHLPERDRKLLLHRREIDHIASKLAEKGLTLVPMKLYFKDGTVKAELGLGRGKNTVDKRQSLKERESKREMQRALRRANR